MIHENKAIPPICGSLACCPKCKGSSVAEMTVPEHMKATLKGYAGKLAVCLNCKTVWEPINVNLVKHPSEPLGAFTEPCDNCAFRKGSTEQEDKAEWIALMSKLRAGGSFYCHKGVPIEAGASDGFAYPRKGDGTVKVNKLRLCRGFVRAWGQWMKQEEVAATTEA